MFSDILFVGVFFKPRSTITRSVIAKCVRYKIPHTIYEEGMIAQEIYDPENTYLLANDGNVYFPTASHDKPPIALISFDPLVPETLRRSVLKDFIRL